MGGQKIIGGGAIVPPCPPLAPPLPGISGHEVRNARHEQYQMSFFTRHTGA